MCPHAARKGARARQGSARCWQGACLGPKPPWSSLILFQLVVYVYRRRAAASRDTHRESTPPARRACFWVDNRKPCWQSPTHPHNTTLPTKHRRQEWGWWWVQRNGSSATQPLHVSGVALVRQASDDGRGQRGYRRRQARARALRACARRSVSTLLSVHFAASSLPSFWIHGKIHGSLKVSCRWRTPHIKLKGVVCLVSTDRTAPTHGRLGPPAPCWRSPTHPFRWRGSPGSRLDHQDQTPPFPVLNLGEVSRRTNGQN